MGVTSLWYRPLPVLLVLMVVGWAQRQQQENPFIIQQQEHRQQMMQKLQLQQLQQAHMDIKPLATKSTQRSAAERGAPPSHRRQQHEEGRGRKSGVHNRNEMHKGRVDGGPGPTPWTRWTPRPRPRHSPWEGQQTGRADTGEWLTSLAPCIHHRSLGPSPGSLWTLSNTGKRMTSW